MIESALVYVGDKAFSWIVGALIGAGGTYLLHYVRTTRPARRTWMLSGKAAVMLTSPEFGTPDVDAPYNSRSRLVDLADQQAIAELVSFLKQWYPSFELFPQVGSSATETLGSGRAHVICVGGPQHNEVSKALLAKGSRFTLIRGTGWRDSVSDRLFEVTISENTLSEDVGVIQVGANPFAPSTRAFVVMGYGAWGTYAAARVLARPKEFGLHRHLARARQFCVVVRTTVVNGSPSHPIVLWSDAGPQWDIQ